MNHNMSIYKRLNLKLLVQVGVSLYLLHWANMFNISLTDCIVESLGPHFQSLIIFSLRIVKL